MAEIMKATDWQPAVTMISAGRRYPPCCGLESSEDSVIIGPETYSANSSRKETPT